MELTNEFTVSVPVDEAWTVLTDLERIAPCMPGAELQEVDGDEYKGVVRVKVGPITAQYKGVASFAERDEAKHRAVVQATGRDTRGQGNASATVTATLEPRGTATHVVVHTDLTITGKVAQFGRGMLADVSGKLLRQFVEALEADVLSGSSPPGNESGNPSSTAAPAADSEAAAGAGTEALSTSRRVESKPAEPVDLLATAGPSALKRLAPVAAVIAAALWIRRRFRRRRARRTS